VSSDAVAKTQIASKATDAAHFGAQCPWRKMEGGIFSKRKLLSCVYPSTNTKVAEGCLIGDETGLSPPLARLRRGDKDGMSVSGGIVRGGEGIQRAFPPTTTSALACRGLRSFGIQSPGGS